MRNIGELIKEQRNKKNLSQRKLAELCGMSYSHICRLEKGENVPSTDTVIKISNALGLPPTTFTLDGDGHVNEFTIQAVEQLAENEVDVFLNLIKHINDNYCIDKFNLSELITTDNFKDLRGLIIDVVISRLTTYKQKNK